jgi:alkanesulfonate monooxygenase SsuD/methylene tetrahydromethanopterin reductase-like flavin-dependent oxidoreductase (luciferase family)
VEFSVPEYGHPLLFGAFISGGRVEMGLGAGAFPRGVEALGGPVRNAGESIEALEERSP